MEKWDLSGVCFWVWEGDNAHLCVHEKEGKRKEPEDRRSCMASVNVINVKTDRDTGVIAMKMFLCGKLHSFHPYFPKVICISMWAYTGLCILSSKCFWHTSWMFAFLIYFSVKKTIYQCLREADLFLWKISYFTVRDG